MQILFVTHYFHPEVGAAQTRILELTRDLSARGHDVTVVTGFPNYPDGVIPPPYRHSFFRVERTHGIRVVRSAVYPAPNRGVARRLLNHLSFAVSALVGCARAGKADVVVVETPPLFTAVSGVLVARLKRAPLVLSIADLWPELAIQMGVLRHRAVIGAAEAVERFAYRHADVLAVPTPGLRRLLCDRGEPPGKVVVVPHGVDPTRFPHECAARRVPRRIIYSGNLGMGHAVGTLLEAARMLEETHPGHEFLIVGDGAERPELEAHARRLALRSVTFAGRVPRERLAGLLASADVGVATQRDLPLLADALSTKVLEYMAAGRPVVGAVSGWTAEVIDRAGAGIVCPPEDPAALADAIARLTADRARAQEMGLHGRQYVLEHLTRENGVDRMEQALKAVAGEGKHGQLGSRSAEHGV